DIGTPAWRRDAQHFVLAGADPEADAPEQTHALWRGDMLAKNLRDARYAKRQLMRRWARRTDRDRRAVHTSTGKRYDECRGIARELGRRMRVECPLETITRIGGCAERAARRAHRARIEYRDFEHNVARTIRHGTFAAADHPCNGLRMVGVRNHGHGRIELALDAVQRRDALA